MFHYLIIETLTIVILERTRGQVPCPLFSPMFDALRPTESAKIECGKKHFEALGTEVGFEDIDSFEEFIEEKVVVK